MIFPLPLTPFESFMLAADCSDLPATIFCRLQFKGRLDKSRFEEAVRAALERHPLLHAIVSPPALHRPVWNGAADAGVAFDWADCGTPLVFPRGRRIDLTSEPGLRVWGRGGPETTAVWFQVHHACCDGTGLLQFLEDILVLYHNSSPVTTGTLSLSPLDPALLRRRGEFPARKRRLLRLRTLREACGTAGFFLRKPIALHAPRESGHADDSGTYPAFHTRRLPPEASQRLAAAAAQSGVTLNTVLLCALFRALRDWTLQNGSGGDAQCLRVAMPFNLRLPIHERMPAANLVSLAFLDQNLSRAPSDEELLKAVCRRTVGVKRRRWGSFVRVLGLFDRLGLLSRVLASRRAHITSMFSNLGDVWPDAPLPRDAGRLVAGDVMLEELDVLPPLRAGMSAGFAAFRYAGRINLCMSYDARSLPSDRAAALLANFVERL